VLSVAGEIRTMKESEEEEIHLDDLFALADDARSAPWSMDADDDAGGVLDDAEWNQSGMLPSMQEYERIAVPSRIEGFGQNFTMGSAIGKGKLSTRLQRAHVIAQGAQREHKKYSELKSYGNALSNFLNESQVSDTLDLFYKLLDANVSAVRGRRRLALLALSAVDCSKPRIIDRERLMRHLGVGAHVARRAEKTFTSLLRKIGRENMPAPISSHILSRQIPRDVKMRARLWADALERHPSYGMDLVFRRPHNVAAAVTALAAGAKSNSTAEYEEIFCTSARTLKKICIEILELKPPVVPLNTRVHWNSKKEKTVVARSVASTTSQRSLNGLERREPILALTRRLCLARSAALSTFS